MTFSFVLDSFPDYTRWDPTHKVLCAIQMVGGSASNGIMRLKTVDGETVAYDATEAHDEPYVE